MPELPEVETIVRDIRPGLLGRRVRRTRLYYEDVLQDVTRNRLLRGLSGARITQVNRRAKHVVLRLDRGTRLVIQPGMTGSLMVVPERLDRPERRHAVLHLTLDRHRGLLFRDARRFGAILLLDREGWKRYDARLGPEPLSPDFTAAALARALGGSRQAIKKALMDQGLLAGVGNIYANEALFAAGVDPSKPATGVGDASWRRLHRQLRRILVRALAAQGTTLRDYRTGTGARGGFQFELQVYGREGEPCRRCGATLTGTHAIDGRITVFCHRCQR